MTSIRQRDFPIVGVGASAGGVEALEGFFRGMPDGPGLGIVIVTHLSPNHESMLHEIVSRYTQLPVYVAADGMLVEMDQPGLSRRAVIADTPIKMTRTQGGVRAPAPLLGEHTHEVLREHGFSEAEIGALESSGALAS